MMKIIHNHIRSLKKKLIPKIFNNLYFLKSDQYKYIKYQNINKDEFYDLRNDPKEQSNIFNLSHDECIKMATYLDNLLKKNKNLEEIKKLITEKEKESVKKVIGRIKFTGI